jgi:hypothetical protein
MAETKYGKYIVTELKLPQVRHDLPPEIEKCRTRILYMDDETMPGALYASTVWYLKVPDGQIGPDPHTHDFDEILAFIGSNPENPHDLGGEIELWIDGEQHTIKKSCLVFIPKGLSHCPFVFKRIDRPIFHFSTGPLKGSYSK